MPLPQPDPSNPALPAPLFADVDAVRGDHLRANNQLIWEDLQYLFDFTGRTTDTLTEGASNLYFTDARAEASAIAAALTGYAAGSDAAIAATDTILQAFGKAQGQITAVKAAQIRYAKISDTKAANTAGGQATADGTYKTRDLQTEDTDPDGLVSISANQFTLAAGTYRISAIVPAYRTTNHKAKLRNMTDGADTLIGSAEYTAGGSDVQTHSFIKGEFTIAGSKTFEIQQRFGSTAATNGLGVAANFGDSEVYTVVEIWKIG